MKAIACLLLVVGMVGCQKPTPKVTIFESQISDPQPVGSAFDDLSTKLDHISVIIKTKDDMIDQYQQMTTELAKLNDPRVAEIMLPRINRISKLNRSLMK